MKHPTPRRFALPCLPGLILVVAAIVGFGAGCGGEDGELPEPQGAGDSANASSGSAATQSAAATQPSAGPSADASPAAAPRTDDATTGTTTVTTTTTTVTTTTTTSAPVGDTGSDSSTAGMEASMDVPRVDSPTTPTTPATDAYAQTLRRVVSDGGWVDYDALAQDHAALDRYIRSLADADLDAMSKDQRLATLINAYNAFTLKLIVDGYDGGELESIMDIPEGERFEARRWRLGGRTVSLNEIENELIRPNFDEPRIHWVLVCAAYSCPPLRTQPYTADQLEEQLAQQERRVLSDERFYEYDADANALRLTSIMSPDWYGEDFVEAAGSVVAYIAKRKENVPTDPAPSVEFIEYDWKLNSRANALAVSSSSRSE